MLSTTGGDKVTLEHELGSVTVTFHTARTVTATIKRAACGHLFAGGVLHNADGDGVAMAQRYGIALLTHTACSRCQGRRETRRPQLAEAAR